MTGRKFRDHAEEIAYILAEFTDEEIAAAREQRKSVTRKVALNRFLDQQDAEAKAELGRMAQHFEAMNAKPGSHVRTAVIAALSAIITGWILVRLLNG